MRPTLRRAPVLIVDADVVTARLLRATLEQDHDADVEIVADYESALDHLGNAARPTRLIMLDPTLRGMDADALMALLREHKAGIAVTLHGRVPPEDLPYPVNFVGAAAYTHLAGSAAASATAAAVVARSLTVHDIIDARRVPPTLDWKSAVAIYAAEPGQPFPLTLRT
jgi:DNA-binding NtrC family response regulator